jgi:alpha-glucosidase
MVQGNPDFTPTDFRSDRLGGSSLAHELAQAVVYTSPFLCYSGSPENYLGNPALNVLRSIPPTWDETRVLPDSEIGRTAAFARRKRNDWFIGVVNGNDERPFRVNLGFLGQGRFRADLLADQSERNDAFNRTSRVVSSRDSLSFDLRRDGGFVAHFSKIPSS